MGMSEATTVKGSAAPSAVSYIGVPPMSARSAYKAVIVDFMSADHIDAVLARTAIADPRNQVPESWEAIKARLRL